MKYKKYIKWGLALVLAVVIVSTSKINITVNTNSAQADTISNMTVDDADRYLEDSLKHFNSESVSTKEAQIANAIYSKEIYKLLKEKNNTNSTK